MGWGSVVEPQLFVGAEGCSVAVGVEQGQSRAVDGEYGLVGLEQGGEGLAVAGRLNTDV